MQPNRLVVMFAGQGVMDRGVFTPSANPGNTLVRDRRPGGLLRTAQSAKSEVADLDLRTYLASIEAYGQLREAGVAPDAIVGHGFGEIAALVAAGAFSITEGAEIVAERFAALADGPTRRYRMASIEGSPRQIRTLLKLLRTDAVSVAAENSTQESVIVGPVAELLAAADLAAGLDIPFVLLKANRGTHHPRLIGAGANMIARLQHIRPRPLQVPVFSPLRRRWYRDGDDPIACLAEQLARPIEFLAAISELAREPDTLLVECGPLRGLAATLDCSSVTDLEWSRRLSATTAIDPRALDLPVHQLVEEVA